MADQSVRLGTGIIEALAATDEPGYERIKATCADYFASFSGSWFDRLARHDEPNRITADDLVAVSMLSTPIALVGHAVTCCRVWACGASSRRLRASAPRVFTPQGETP